MCHPLLCSRLQRSQRVRTLPKKRITARQARAMQARQRATQARQRVREQRSAAHHPKRRAQLRQLVQQQAWQSQAVPQTQRARLLVQRALSSVPQEW